MVERGRGFGKRQRGILVGRQSRRRVQAKTRFESPSRVSIHVKKKLKETQKKERDGLGKRDDKETLRGDAQRSPGQGEVNYQSARSDIFLGGWLDSGPPGPHGTPGR